MNNVPSEATPQSKRRKKGSCREVPAGTKRPLTGMVKLDESDDGPATVFF